MKDQKKRNEKSGGKKALKIKKENQKKDFQGQRLKKVIPFSFLKLQRCDTMTIKSGLDAPLEIAFDSINERKT